MTPKDRHDMWRSDQVHCPYTLSCDLSWHHSQPTTQTCDSSYYCTRCTVNHQLFVFSLKLLKWKSILSGTFVSIHLADTFYFFKTTYKWKSKDKTAMNFSSNLEKNLYYQQLQQYDFNTIINDQNNITYFLFIILFSLKKHSSVWTQ